MKKLIVAALAVAMMSSVAVAATVPETKTVTLTGTATTYTKNKPKSAAPGGSFKLGPTQFGKDYIETDVTGTGATRVVNEYQYTTIPSDVDFTDEFFVVSAKKFTKGASLVKSIAFVDDSSDGYCLKVSLNQDYNNDISRYTNKNGVYSNLVFSDLALKAKKTVKDADGNKILSKGTEYKFLGTGKLYGQVGYKYTADVYSVNVAGTAYLTYEKSGDAVNDEYTAESLMNATVYSTVANAGNDDFAAVMNGKVYMDSDEINLTVKSGKTHAFQFKADKYSYAVVDATYDDIAYTEGRVYDGDKVIYKYNQDVTTSILRAYPDAELEFVNMKTSDLPATCYFELYADEDKYVYKLENGKLAKSGLKWDEDVYAWVGKYRTATTYVISDIPLSTAPARDEVEVSDIEVIAPIEVVPSVPVVVVNPETGR